MSQRVNLKNFIFLSLFVMSIISGIETKKTISSIGSTGSSLMQLTSQETYKLSNENKKLILEIKIHQHQLRKLKRKNSILYNEIMKDINRNQLKILKHLIAKRKLINKLNAAITPPPPEPSLISYLNKEILRNKIITQLIKIKIINIKKEIINLYLSKFREVDNSNENLKDQILILKLQLLKKLDQIDELSKSKRNLVRRFAITSTRAINLLNSISVVADEVLDLKQQKIKLKILIAKINAKVNGKSNSNTTHRLKLNIKLNLLKDEKIHRLKNRIHKLKLKVLLGSPGLKIKLNKLRLKLRKREIELQSEVKENIKLAKLSAYQSRKIKTLRKKLVKTLKQLLDVKVKNSGLSMKRKMNKMRIKTNRLELKLALQRKKSKLVERKLKLDLLLTKKKKQQEVNLIQDNFGKFRLKMADKIQDLKIEYQLKIKKLKAKSNKTIARLRLKANPFLHRSDEVIIKGLRKKLRKADEYLLSTKLELRRIKRNLIDAKMKNLKLKSKLKLQKNALFARKSILEAKLNSLRAQKAAAVSKGSALKVIKNIAVLNKKLEKD